MALEYGNIGEGELDSCGVNSVDDASAYSPFLGSALYPEEFYLDQVWNKVHSKETSFDFYETYLLKGCSQVENMQKNIVDKEASFEKLTGVLEKLNNEIEGVKEAISTLDSLNDSQKIILLKKQKKNLEDVLKLKSQQEKN